MSKRFVSERNIKFLLFEVFDVESLTQYPYYVEYDKKTFNMILQAAIELAEGVLWPVFKEMDSNPPVFEKDYIKAHPSVKKIMKEFGEGGWIGATVHENHEGQQMPHLIADSCLFTFAAANYSASAFVLLSTGAAHLIELFGTQDMHDTYLPKILEGKWQGTMAMTEPGAGSSLSDIITEAVPTDNGFYRISGQKIFISAGDHNGVENTVHMLLARIKGAPQGVKGISLFIVPKKRIENGTLVANDVATSGIFHKLGYRGCPLAQLSFGDKGNCHGYLIGEENKGLSYMFRMMNEERIGVGIGATAGATAAYYASFEFSKTRIQGRKPDRKNPTRPQVPIIEHPDVKRMLLFQRAVVEGSLSLLLQCSKYLDLQRVAEGEDRVKYSLLLDILTPVAKSYPSEMGILSVSAGLQCLGGSGFCEDYPLEQYYRDARIHPIHEGTTGIHGIDLLGRKVIMQNGKAFKLFLKEVRVVIEEAGNYSRLKIYSEQLAGALESLESVTAYLMETTYKKGQEYYLADANLYLEFFGIIAIAWQWLLQAVSIAPALDRDVADKDMVFYEGKFFTFRYFYGYELPKIEGLIIRLMNGEGLTVEMTEALFED